MPATPGAAVAQFFIDQGQQFLRRVGLAALNRRQELGQLSHGMNILSKFQTFLFEKLL